MIFHLGTQKPKGTIICVTGHDEKDDAKDDIVDEKTESYGNRKDEKGKAIEEGSEKNDTVGKNTEDTNSSTASNTDT